MLSVVSVSKRYGDHLALDDVSLAAARGEIVTLLGANGAGKSTLMSLVAGLRRPERGQVVVGEPGGDPHVAGHRELLGFAPQELGVYPTISVAANLLFFAELAGLRGPEAKVRVEETAEALGLGPFLDRPAGQLSGGERRRVHVGMALVNRPQLLLLDEPTAGVDVAARMSLVQLVISLAEQGNTVLYSTHYLAEAEAIDGRVAILHHGRLVADSTVGALTDGLPGRVTLAFEGPAPQLVLPEGLHARTDGSNVTVHTLRPDAQAAAVLHAVGPDLGRLRAVEVLPASLEDAYLAATGDASLGWA